MFPNCKTDKVLLAFSGLADGHCGVLLPTCLGVGQLLRL